MKKKLEFRQLVQVLALLTLVTSLISCCMLGVFAEYKTSVSGTASVSVAKFDVEIKDAPADSTTFELTEGGEGAEYPFTVVNHSDVSVNGTVRVDFTAAPAAGITMTVGEQSLNTDGTTTTFLFDQASFSLSYANDTNTDEVQVTLKISAGSASQQNGLENITVSVEIVQAN